MVGGLSLAGRAMPCCDLGIYKCGKSLPIAAQGLCDLAAVTCMHDGLPGFHHELTGVGYPPPPVGQGGFFERKWGLGSKTRSSPSFFFQEKWVNSKKVDSYGAVTCFLFSTN